MSDAPKTTITLPFSPEDVRAGRVSILGFKCPHCDGTGKLASVTVGDLIVTRRKQLGFTQEVLSKAVGLSRGQIANIEVGRTDMPLKTLARFAEALDCTMKDLVP